MAENSKWQGQVSALNSKMRAQSGRPLFIYNSFYLLLPQELLFLINNLGYLQAEYCLYYYVIFLFI